MEDNFDEAAFVEAMQGGTTVIDEPEQVQAEPEEQATPEAQAEPEKEPVTTEPLAAEQPKEIIKEVEKIVEVEKWPEFKDEKAKKLYEQFISGEYEDALRDYLTERKKDYTTMSDLDVRREALSKEHPNWSKKDVELEIRHTYGANLEKYDLSEIDKDDNPDEYKEAVEHNKQVDKNLELLAVHSRDDRYKLIDQQKKIELPQIKKAAAPEASGPTPEEIEAANQKWVKSVEEQMPRLGSIKQTIDNKEVAYDLTDTDKTAMADKMKTFNIFNYGKERGWYNEDGSPNVTKLAEDVLKLDNFDKITKAFATQVKTTATKDVLKEIKNIDDTKRSPEATAVNSLEDAFYQSKHK